MAASVRQKSGISRLLAFEYEDAINIKVDHGLFLSLVLIIDPCSRMMTDRVEKSSDTSFVGLFSRADGKRKPRCGWAARGSSGQLC